jgi:hypothetical protein
MRKFTAVFTALATICAAAALIVAPAFVRASPRLFSALESTSLT